MGQVFDHQRTPEEEAEDKRFAEFMAGQLRSDPEIKLAFESEEEEAAFQHLFDRMHTRSQTF